MTVDLAQNAAPPTGCENAGQRVLSPVSAGASRWALPPNTSGPVHALSRGTNLIEPFSRIDRDPMGRVVRMAPLRAVPFAAGGIRWNDGLRAWERGR